MTNKMCSTLVWFHVCLLLVQLLPLITAVDPNCTGPLPAITPRLEVLESVYKRNARFTIPVVLPNGYTEYRNNTVTVFVKVHGLESLRGLQPNVTAHFQVVRCVDAHTQRIRAMPVPAWRYVPEINMLVAMFSPDYMHAGCRAFVTLSSFSFVRCGRTQSHNVAQDVNRIREFILSCRTVLAAPCWAPRKLDNHEYQLYMGEPSTGSSTSQELYLVLLSVIGAILCHSHVW